MEMEKENKYLITGATGYIGSMLVNYICNMEVQEKKRTQVTVLVRDRNKASKMLPQEVLVQEMDITDRSAMERLQTQRFDYIIHCAAPTKSAYMISNPVETAMTIVEGTRNVLELARHCGTKSVVYLSSMEVYGSIDCSQTQRIKEGEWGTVEVLNARSSYPMGKRMAENLCFAYFAEYGIPVKIARLAQTFGCGVLPEDNRVFVQFARAVQRNENIVLHTEGNSMGNYCAIDDAISAIMLLLTQGAAGEAYNVVNEANTMTIRQMAELVADKIANGRIQICYDIPKENQYGYAAATGLRLSAEKLQRLGWNPKKDLEQMYLDLLSTIPLQQS